MKTILKIFKWITLIFSILLIIIGSISIDENSNSIITIGILTVVLAITLLFFIIYILKTDPNATSWGFSYVIVLMIIFGIGVGTTTAMNSIDTTIKSDIRNTLGWIIGGLSCSIGITGLLWTLISLFQSYEIKPFDTLPKWI